MLAHTYTATFVGLQAIPVKVEIDGNRGVPALVFIGLASKATEEARERITAALQNSGRPLRAKRTIINLAPADVPKHGTGFDLAIAVGILRMYGELTAKTDDTLFLGELALDGRVQKIKGCLPLVLAAKAWGFTRVFLPVNNAAEVSIVDGIKLIPVPYFKDLLAHLAGESKLPVLQPQSYTVEVNPAGLSAGPSSVAPAPATADQTLDFDDIIGQAELKRALVVAIAGGHNILLSGSPGIGKSALAHCLTSILPPLTRQEAMEVTAIYSLAGWPSGQLITTRPFRSPHHTVSYAGLVGGGNPPRPGEISLAHHGVLFLDELPEFPSNLLETLRQPLESKNIILTRASGAVEFPADFMLVAAMNPCPCGFRDSVVRECTCSDHQRERYDHKLSGPLLDRIDLRIRVPDVPVGELAEEVGVEGVGGGLTAAAAKSMIQTARNRQASRWHKLSPNLSINSQLTSKQVRLYCPLEPAATKLLNQSAENLHLSARSYFKVWKVAQTIADLAEANKISVKHLGEALQYR